MRERPILFSGAMVRAILAGQKTQTRRAAKGAALEWLERDGFTPVFVADPSNALCPYGQPGDRLWVREVWRTREKLNRLNATEIVEKADDAGFPSPSPGHPACPLRYEADGRALVWGSNDFVDFGDWGRLRLARFMPRWASRLTLAVESIRVERLQDISEEDAKAEGVEPAPFCKAGRPAGMEHVEAFEDLWQTINAKRPGCSWEDSPWVWVISYSVAEVRR